MVILLSSTAAATMIRYSSLEKVEIPILGTTSQVNFEDLLITAPDTVIEISLDVPERYDFIDVLSIHIEHSSCYYFPHGFTKYFKRIFAINVENSKLKAITKNDLQPFQWLTILSLKGNLLTTLEAKLFMSNPHLEIVSFSNNRIHLISAELYHGTTITPQIEFSHNSCIIRDTFSMTRSEVESAILKNCQPRRHGVFKLPIVQSMRWIRSRKPAKSHFKKTWFPALVESGIFCWYWIVSNAIWLASLTVACIALGFMMAEMIEVAYVAYLWVKMHGRTFIMRCCDYVGNLFENNEE